MKISILIILIHIAFPEFENVLKFQHLEKNIPWNEDSTYNSNVKISFEYIIPLLCIIFWFGNGKKFCLRGRMKKGFS